MSEAKQGVFFRPVAGAPLWRHLCALGAILLLCGLLFVWAGYTFLPDAVDTSRREIINDTYGTAENPILTQPLGVGDEIRQSFAVTGRLYGVVLNVATFNRVAHGTLHLRLLDSTGNQVAACDTDMTTLLDNTFHRFLFDNMIDMDQQIAVFTLVITASPATGEDVVAFHRSEGLPPDYVEENAELPHYPINDMPYAYVLTEDGNEVDGMLALQFTTHYAGTFIVRAYSFFAAFLTVFLLALYVFCFMLRVPIQRVFVLCALCLGFVFMFLIPPLAAPDEYGHIATAVHYSNLWLGQAQYDTLSQVQMPEVAAADNMTLYHYDSDSITLFAWQDLAENLFSGRPLLTAYDIPRIIPARVILCFPPMMVVPALGVTFGRLLGLGKVGVLLLGRLFNLVFYTALFSGAIKRMPFAKPMLFCVGILPMSLQLAASFSYDTYVFALSAYFIACCLDYAFAKKQVDPRQLLLLLVLTLLLAPAKYVYLLLLPFVLIIPAAWYPSQRFCRAARAVVLGGGLAIWLAFSVLIYSASDGMAGPFAVASPTENTPITSLSVPAVVDAPTNSLLTPSLAEEGHLLLTGADPANPEIDILPNGDARQHFTIGYIFTHLPKTIRLVIRTLWEQPALWLQGLLGGRLGEIIAVDIEINWVFIIGLLGILLAGCLPTAEDSHVLTKNQRAGSLAIVLAIAGALLVTCLSWTPINYTTVFGLQGRYLLPVLPLILLALRGQAIQLKKPIWPKLAFAAAALVVLCQLDAFIIILGL